MKQFLTKIFYIYIQNSHDLKKKIENKEQKKNHFRWRQ